MRIRQPQPKLPTRPTLDEWQLRLYVAGQTPRCLSAIANLRIICEQHLRGKYAIEVIDLRDDPQRARGDGILAVPTLVRMNPPPSRKIIGDLSNSEHVLRGLEVPPPS